MITKITKDNIQEWSNELEYMARKSFESFLKDNREHLKELRK